MINSILFGLGPLTKHPYSVTICVWVREMKPLKSKEWQTIS